MREVAIGTLALAKAMYGVELADVGSRDVARLELAAVRALWGPTRTSRAKEVLWAVLVPGHRVSPAWRLQYSRVLWLARQARMPGAGQVLVQAILEETYRPPDTESPPGKRIPSSWFAPPPPHGATHKCSTVWRAADQGRKWWKREWALPSAGLQHDVLSRALGQWTCARHADNAGVCPDAV